MSEQELKDNGATVKTTTMNILAYLQSKTVQGILGLVALGIIKNYHVTILDDQTLLTLSALFMGWLGIGIRDAIKPIVPKP